MKVNTGAAQIENSSHKKSLRVTIDTKLSLEERYRPDLC